MDGGPESGGDEAGPGTDRVWLEHFYLDPAAQGRGLGGAVLAAVLAGHEDGRPVWLAIDRGSPVRRLYERHGFTYQSDDPNGVDQLFRREPSAVASGLGGEAVDPGAGHTQALVRRMLRAGAPGFAGLPLARARVGWDNELWRLGAGLAVRVTRRAESVGLHANGQRWFPFLELRLSLPVCLPVYASGGVASSRGRGVSCPGSTATSQRRLHRPARSRLRWAG